MELSRRFLSRGNAVIVTGRDPDKPAAAKRTLPGEHAAHSDGSDVAAIAALDARSTVECPQLGSIVNNAGVVRNIKLGGQRLLEDVTREIDIDLSGSIQMVQRFLRLLPAQIGPPSN